jgi:hypothetical protein
VKHLHANGGRYLESMKASSRPGGVFKYKVKNLGVLYFHLELVFERVTN